MDNENIVSRNLMKLNVYYNDTRYSNKKLMFLVGLREHLEEVRIVFKGLINIRKQGIGKTWLQLKSLFCQKLVVDKKIEYSFDHTDELSYKIVKKHMPHEIAVYTSIFGGYDSLIEPLYKSEYCDYYAITDQEIPKDSIWKKIDTSALKDFNKMDDYHKSKYCKMFPHILFPNYQYSVWVDGNVQIVADLMPLVDRLGSFTMATFENPKHNCIYTEANFNICQNNVKVDELKKQVDIYKKEGFPTQFGMREFSIIVREHNNSELKTLMDDWWKQVNIYTMRDQISFPYVLWKNNKPIDYIKSLGINWRWNPRFILYPHKWHINYDK